MDKSATQWMIEPLKKYATFSGRARRKEYWWFQLFVMLVTMLAFAADAMINGVDALIAGATGYVQAAESLLLVWYCSRGTIGDNRFGPDPISE